MILVIDTETTGLFDYSKRADEEGQPRLCQLAGIAVDDKWQIIPNGPEFNLFVRPDGWSVGDATAIHGLTDDYLMEHGLPISVVLDRYQAAHELAEKIGGYSANYDLKVLRGEMRRAGRPDLYGQKPVVEVIHKAAAMCKAQGAPGGGKLKRLGLAHEILLGEPMAGAHSAHADVLATIRIMRKIIDTMEN